MAATARHAIQSVVRVRETLFRAVSVLAKVARY
jgi:hypothetical protein